MLVSWILQSIDPKLAESIPFHDDAKRLWEYLERRFCVANGPRIQQLRAQISDCRQSKTMTIEAYYTKLLGLYDELNRLKPLHVCSCGLCTSNVAGKFVEDRREEIFHQFLIGIDDDYYANVRSNLLSQSPPADLNRAYQALIQEERSRNNARDKVVTDETHAFAVQGNRPRASPRPASTRPFDGSDKSGFFVLTVIKRAMIEIIVLNSRAILIGILNSFIVAHVIRPLLLLRPLVLVQAPLLLHVVARDMLLLVHICVRAFLLGWRCS
ncbi:50S ribosomal protein L5 [Bienertia sinuspersici]